MSWTCSTSLKWLSVSPSRHPLKINQDSDELCKLTYNQESFISDNHLIRPYLLGQAPYFVHANPSTFEYYDMPMEHSIMVSYTITMYYFDSMGE